MRVSAFFLAVLGAATTLVPRASGDGKPARIEAGRVEAGRVEAMDVLRLEHVLDPRVSPDGKTVVFIREWKDLAADRWRTNLWRVGSDGEGLAPLTRGASSDRSPRFSPDGRKVAFLSDRGGTTQVWVASLDGSNATAITDLGHEPWGIAWSPDGRWIAYAAHEPTPVPPLVELPQPPSGASWAEPPRVIDRLPYRRDGWGYLEPGQDRLFVVPADGGPPRRASRDSEPKDEVAIDLLHHRRDDGAAAWTPDGRFLITAANRRGDALRAPADTELYEVSLDDGTLRPLTDRRGPDVLPTVSPDGRRIAFVGFDERGRGYQVAELWVMDREGGPPRSLTPDLDRDVTSPRWSGDGKSLFFLYHDRGETRIGRVGLDGGPDGGEIAVVASGVGEGYGTYGSDGSFTVARDGTVAFPLTRPSLASAVALATPGDDLARLLATLNGELFAGKELAQVEEIAVTAADGLKVQTWVMKPPGFDPARPYPTVLDIHGGPHRDYGLRFDVEKQLWASRGYLVVYANPRGSAGYGEAFADLIHHAYPGDDVTDLEAVVEAVVERGWADPENLFVTGGSGGALLALELAARSDRFRAVVATYPVVNWTSLVLTSDLQALALSRWFPGPPWEHPEHYWRRSPLAKAGTIDAPTMLILGERDYRTVPAEAEQLYAALRYRGVEAVMVRLPDEPHFSEERPSHYLARMLYTVGWFDLHRSDGSTPDP